MSTQRSTVTEVRYILATSSLQGERLAIVHTNMEYLDRDSVMSKSSYTPTTIGIKLLIGEAWCLRHGHSHRYCGSQVQAARFGPEVKKKFCESTTWHGWNFLYCDSAHLP